MQIIAREQMCDPEIVFRCWRKKENCHLSGQPLLDFIRCIAKKRLFLHFTGQRFGGHHLPGGLNRYGWILLIVAVQHQTGKADLPESGQFGPKRF